MYFKLNAKVKKIYVENSNFYVEGSQPESATPCFYAVVAGSKPGYMRFIPVYGAKQGDVVHVLKTHKNKQIIVKALDEHEPDGEITILTHSSPMLYADGYFNSLARGFIKQNDSVEYQTVVAMRDTTRLL